MRPESAWDALRHTGGPCVLVESVGAGGPLAQLCVLAARPRAVVVADRDEVRVETASDEQRLRADPLDVLRALVGEVTPGNWPEEGGAAGLLAYDYARPHRPPANTPLLFAVVVDRFQVFPAAAAEPAADARRVALELPAFSSLTRKEYRRRVLQAKDHIAAGDIYQANLSQRFRVPYPGDGLRLYSHLRRISPAPFSGYVRGPGFELVSSSPERLLRVEGRHASTRPIAGTRPRVADPARDDALRAELLLSDKERAEHLMLLDLARNDLGKVAAIGSVRVDEMMVVEEYSHVRHIVSNVAAELAPGRDALDALRALFPGGTITGVPKLRCMQILDGLEPVPRGFYSGSLFYLTRSGRLDANILIRSAVVADGFATFHAGGGIVADSDPDLEYEETLHKAEGMRLALEEAREESEQT